MELEQDKGHIRTIQKSRGGRNITFYVCPKCRKQRTFMVLQNLKRHIKTFHNHGLD